MEEKTRLSVLPYRGTSGFSSQSFAIHYYMRDFLCEILELYHLEHENSEQHLTLQVFKGGISETLRAAADKGQLNDHMMAMAPMGRCIEEVY